MPFNPFAQDPKPAAEPSAGPQPTRTVEDGRNAERSDRVGDDGWGAMWGGGPDQEDARPDPQSGGDRDQDGRDDDWSAMWSGESNPVGQDGAQDETPAETVSDVGPADGDWGSMRDDRPDTPQSGTEEARESGWEDGQGEDAWNDEQAETNPDRDFGWGDMWDGGQSEPNDERPAASSNQAEDRNSGRDDETQSGDFGWGDGDSDRTEEMRTQDGGKPEPAEQPDARPRHDWRDDISTETQAVPAFDWGVEEDTEDWEKDAEAEERRPFPWRIVVAAILTLAILSASGFGAAWFVRHQAERKAREAFDASCAALTATGGEWRRLLKEAKTLGVDTSELAAPDLKCAAGTNGTDRKTAKAEGMVKDLSDTVDAALDKRWEAFRAEAKRHSDLDTSALTKTKPKTTADLDSLERRLKDMVDKAAKRKAADDARKAEEEKRKAEEEKKAAEQPQNTTEQTPSYTPPAQTYTPPAQTYTPPAQTYTPPARPAAPQAPSGSSDADM